MQATSETHEATQQPEDQIHDRDRHNDPQHDLKNTANDRDADQPRQIGQQQPDHRHDRHDNDHPDDQLLQKPQAKTAHLSPSFAHASQSSMSVSTSGQSVTGWQYSTLFTMPFGKYSIALT